jgi:hypothetical protein
VFQLAAGALPPGGTNTLPAALSSSEVVMFCCAMPQLTFSFWAG